MLPENMFNSDIYKITLSQPQTAVSRIEILKNGDAYQASEYKGSQVFHANPTDIAAYINAQFGKNFLQYTAWDSTREYTARITKKGKTLTNTKPCKNPPKPPQFAGGGFNRQKRHIIGDNDNIPILKDIGISKKDGKLVQINRFLELLHHETAELPPQTIVNIIDFGCGKSYLTFLVYHYFAEILGLDTHICGLDLKEEVIQNCTAAARKYGYKNLSFRQGDIAALAAPPPEGWGDPAAFNAVISLHACDTATDHALYNALKWQADLICAAPCCQHELRGQMRPKNLSLLSDHGIIKERFAALATDAIRAEILHLCGYKTHLIEFTDSQHTSKNLLIRARRVNTGKMEIPVKIFKNQKSEKLDKILQEFAFKPKLLELLLSENAT